MKSRLQRFIEDHELLLPPGKAVVGVSGGVDSVALLRLLASLEVELQVVHVNYKLRGEASDADAGFVRRLCEDLDVPLIVHEHPIGDGPESRHRSTQELAREIRYQIFEEIARERDISRVAVGHQMDDQIETLILQLVRGTGLRGLAGMPRRRPIRRGSAVTLIRPLLFARRQEIEAHARECQWEWREDRSNASDKYLRTALRQHVLPRLEEQVGSGGFENIARTADLVREYLDAEWIPRLNRDLERLVEENEESGISLDLCVLEESSRIWQQELLLEVVRRYVPQVPVSEAVGEELADLVDAQVGRRKEYAAHTIWRERKRLYIAPHRAEAAEGEQSLQVGDRLVLPGQGHLSLTAEDAVPRPPGATGRSVALIDAGRVDLPLRVRPWREGDRLQPLGMEGHKNVSDILTEAKVPPHRRPHVHVVTSNDQIVWIVNFRLANPVRIRPETTRVLKLSLQPFFPE